MVFLDKYGWPVVTIRNKWFVNTIRKLIHTRKIVQGMWDGYKVVRPVGKWRPLLPVFDENNNKIGVTHISDDADHHDKFFCGLRFKPIHPQRRIK
jgi:hypothetical protein